MRYGFLSVLAITGILNAQPKIPDIAVLELDGNGIAATDLGGLSNRLRTELFNTGKFTVIERSKMNEILKEQGFQQSGCTITECAVQIGQLIGVQKMVLGSVDKVMELYSVNLRMVDVKSGKIEQNVVQDCEGCSLTDVMKTAIRNSARKMAGLQIDTTINRNQTSANNSSVAPTPVDISKRSDEPPANPTNQPTVALILGPVLTVAGAILCIYAEVGNSNYRGPDNPYQVPLICGEIAIVTGISIDIVGLVKIIKRYDWKKNHKSFFQL
ncbi:MAG: CsgG/HfaB family protein [Chitinivibrionales bacterium]